MEVQNLDLDSPLTFLISPPRGNMVSVRGGFAFGFVRSARVGGLLDSRGRALVPL